jgi:hypothetical protein
MLSSPADILFWKLWTTLLNSISVTSNRTKESFWLTVLLLVCECIMSSKSLFTVSKKVTLNMSQILLGLFHFPFVGVYNKSMYYSGGLFLYLLIYTILRSVISVTYNMLNVVCFRCFYYNTVFLFTCFILIFIHSFFYSFYFLQVIHIYSWILLCI